MDAAPSGAMIGAVAPVARTAPASLGFYRPPALLRDGLSAGDQLDLIIGKLETWAERHAFGAEVKEQLERLRALARDLHRGDGKYRDHQAELLNRHAGDDASGPLARMAFRIYEPRWIRRVRVAVKLALRIGEREPRTGRRPLVITGQGAYAERRRLSRSLDCVG